jgi:hypothetical protein
MQLGGYPARAEVLHPGEPETLGSWCCPRHGRSSARVRGGSKRRRGQRPQLRLQLVEVDRLGDELRRAVFGGAAAALVVTVGGHHHHRQARPAPFDLLQQLQPVHAESCVARSVYAGEYGLDRRESAPICMRRVERARKREWFKSSEPACLEALEASVLATGRKNLAVGVLAQAARERAVKLAPGQLAAPVAPIFEQAAADRAAAGYLNGSHRRAGCPVNLLIDAVEAMSYAEGTRNCLFVAVSILRMRSSLRVCARLPI